MYHGLYWVKSTPNKKKEKTRLSLVIVEASRMQRVHFRDQAFLRARKREKNHSNFDFR